MGIREPNHRVHKRRGPDRRRRGEGLRYSVAFSTDSCRDLPLAVFVFIPGRLIVLAGSIADGAVAVPAALLALLVHHETLDDACASAPLAFALAVAPHTCAHVRLLGVVVGKHSLFPEEYFLH